MKVLFLSLSAFVPLDFSEPLLKILPSPLLMALSLAIFRRTVSIPLSIYCDSSPEIQRKRWRMEWLQKENPETGQGQVHLSSQHIASGRSRRVKSKANLGYIVSWEYMRSCLHTKIISNYGNWYLAVRWGSLFQLACKGSKNRMTAFCSLNSDLATRYDMQEHS